jgi:hypothetical protein
MGLSLILASGVAYELLLSVIIPLDQGLSGNTKSLNRRI